MDWTAFLLKLGIDILTALLPMLASLIGGPLGWLAGIAVSYLTKLLAAWAERYARFAKIDAGVQKQVDAVKATTNALRNATADTQAKALADFRAAVRDLTRFNTSV